MRRSSRARIHLKEIMTSSNTERQHERQDRDDKSDWMTHRSHMAAPSRGAGETRLKPARAPPHGRLKREKSKQKCPIFWCVMIPGTLLLCRSAAQSGDSRLLSPPCADGKLQRGGWDSPTASAGMVGLALGDAGTLLQPHASLQAHRERWRERGRGWREGRQGEIWPAVRRDHQPLPPGGFEELRLPE